MPNIKSAMKRVKVNSKKHSENRSAKSELSTAIRKFKAVVMTANSAEAEKLFPITVSLIDSAAAKGIIHKNNASRKVSDLSILMRDLRAGKITAPVAEERKSKTATKKKDAPAAAEVKPTAEAKPAAEEKKTAAKKPAAKPTEEKPKKETAKAAEEKKDEVKKEVKKPAAKKTEKSAEA